MPDFDSDTNNPNNPSYYDPELHPDHPGDWGDDNLSPKASRNHSHYDIRDRRLKIWLLD